MPVSSSGAPGLLVVDGTEPNIQIGDPAATDPKPRNWYDVLRSVAENMTGAAPERFLWRRLLEGRCAFLSWGPNLRILSASLLGRRTAYLCWGLPKAGGSRIGLFLRTKRLRAILRHVDTVLVNDEVTRDEIRRLAGREATVIPLVVDTDYFRFAPAGNRGKFVLVPGDNDRDERLVAELASRGIEVVRIARSPWISETYRRSRGGANVTVRLFVSYSELRSSYQRASVVLLPLTTDNHAAGQTSLLEAVACGAPVVISETRTSKILGNHKSILVCPSRRAEDWVARIREAEVLTRCDPDVALNAAAAIRLTHHPEAVADRLVSVLRRA